MIPAKRHALLDGEELYRPVIPLGPTCVSLIEVEALEHPTLLGANTNDGGVRVRGRLGEDPGTSPLG